MPARREYTPEELQDRLARQRELTRERVARLRARRKVTRYQTPVSVTPEAVRVTGGPEAGPVSVTPPAPPVLASLSSSKRREIRDAGARLAPLAERGYRHDQQFWEVLARECPDVNLLLEAIGMEDWLTRPVNRKCRCSKGFIRNWIRKAQRDATAPPNGAPPAARPAGRPAPGKPPDPEPVLPPDVTLQPIDFADYQRAVGEARKRPLEERLAGARNGKHG